MLKLSVFIFVEVLQLLLIFLREGVIEASKSVISCGITKGSTLMTESVELVTQSPGLEFLPNADCA